MAKGRFIPKNPSKYLGNPEKIRFLSKWEQLFMVFLDTNPNVIGWGSEEFHIPYWNPIKKKVVAYYPDFIVKFKDAGGVVKTQVIEIKPKKEAVFTPGKKISLYDQVQLVINSAKWTAATAYCKNAGIEFRVLTEQNLFRQ